MDVALLLTRAARYARGHERNLGEVPADQIQNEEEEERVQKQAWKGGDALGARNPISQD